MIADLRPYPAMKNSGVAWLGEVPEHWKVLPNRAIFNEVKERDRPEAQMLSVTISRGVIQQAVLLADSSKRDSSNQDKSSYKVVRPGDIAYNKMRAWQGAIGVSEHEGIVSPAYVVQRPRGGAAPRYLHYLLRTPSFAKEAERWSYGITSDMWSLRPEHFKMIYSCLPPLPEQHRIVQFLDHADRRVRRYIHAKQRLIKLLEEQKQSLIHRTVTQGVYPDVRLKPSGVEWMGDVPEHWEVVRNKTVCRLGTGHTPSRKVAEYWIDCTIPWFTLSDVHQIRGDRVKHVRETKERVSELGIANSAAVKLPRGTVILSRTASVGWSAILDCDMATSQDFMAWMPGPRISSEYLLAVLRAMRPEFSRLMYGSTHNTIYMPVLHDFRMPLPPPAEQAAIVDHIDRATSKFAAACATADREIALLREYRTRLITDVVTGKFDVRDSVARLPSDSDEPECDESDGLDGTDEPAAEEADFEEVEA